MAGQGAADGGPIGTAAANISQPGVVRRYIDVGAHLEVQRGLEQGYQYWAQRARLSLPIHITSRVTFVPSYNLEVYELDHVLPSFNPDNPTQVLPSPILQSCQGNVCLLSYLEQRIEWDGRDDPINTRRGFYAALSVQEGGRVGGYGYGYLRLLPEARVYLAIGERSVLAARARLGAFIPVKETRTPPTVALFESGGANAMRGYGLNRLSPMTQTPDGPVPYGGNGLAEYTLEYRFPLTKSLFGAVFTDAAYVSYPSAVPNAYRYGLDPGRLQWAAGFGIRFRTPVGPLRLDLAGRLPNDLVARRGIRGPVPARARVAAPDGPGSASRAHPRPAAHRRGGVLVRALRVGLVAIGWGLLGTMALVGVALSALVLYAGSATGRRVVASALIQLADAKVAGSLKLGGVDLQPGGAIAIRDFEAYDPDGHLVLQVDRLVVSADVTRLRNKVVGLDVELDGAAVLVDEDEEGKLSLARAFAPAHPAPPSARREKPPFWRDPLGGWTIRLPRLAIRDTSVWWQDAAGRTRFEAQELSLDARGLLGPGRGRAELSLRGQALAPVPGPLAFQLRVLLDGDGLRVPVLRAQVGETELEGLAQGDLGRRIGRAALTRATLVREEARDLVKSAPAGANLTLEAYAEADGRLATGAVHVAPVAKGGAGGGDAAVAVRLDGTRALGFDVATQALDPSALASVLPSASLTLTARGGLAGESLGSARGNLDLDLARSRFRAGELGPAVAVVRLDRGSWNVSRLSLAAPGLRVDGAGSFQQGGAASAHFTAELADLARAGDNAGKLLGRPLPRAAGRASVDANLGGTAAAPTISAQVASPSLALGGTSAAGLQAHVEASGPFRPGKLRVQARVQRLSSGARVVAQTLALDGALAPAPGEPGAATATLSASALLPSLGKEPVSVDAAAALPRDHKTLRVSGLALAYPGTRYALEAPATLTLAGPRVDRLALASGPRRIAVEGGVGPRKTLDARLEVVKLNLAKLPAGLLPAEERIAGELSADVRATGALARPHLEGRFEVQSGAFRTEQALTVKGTARYDGAGRRVAAQLGVARGSGGRIELEGDLPVPFRGRAAEPVSATLRVDGLPIPALVALAGAEVPLSGRMGANLRLTGTVGTPALRAQVTVADGTFRDLEGIGLDATANLAAAGEATAEVRLADRPAVRLQARAPMSMSALLAEPGRTLKGLRQARIDADATALDLELAAVSGRLGIPSGLRGRLTGEGHAAGPPGALRGTVALAVADGAYAGYTGIAARLDGAARDDGVEARVSAQLQGQDLLQLTAALRAPPERLATRAGLDAARLLVDGTVPGVDLERAAAPSGVALGGVVEVKLHGEGTLARPVLQLDGSGRAIHVKGRPVGQLRIAVRAAGDRATAELSLDPPAGGKLTATAAVTVPISIDLRTAALRAAPAQVKVRAEAVDLGFVPAVLPGAIRSAAGKLDADITAAGPLARLAPRGTARLTGGRLALLEYGDWTGLTLDGAVTEDAVEIRTFEAHRGEGTLQLRAALRGLTTRSAQLDGRLETKQLTFSRAGMDVATVTVGVKASGTYRDGRLEARLDVPEGLVRLPDKLPRNLQSLEKRPDIVIGPKPPPKKTTPAPVPAASEGGKPFTAEVRLVAPGKFSVQRGSPRIQVELKTDVTYTHQAGGDLDVRLGRRGARVRRAAERSPLRLEAGAPRLHGRAAQGRAHRRRGLVREHRRQCDGDGHGERTRCQARDQPEEPAPHGRGEDRHAHRHRADGGAQGGRRGAASAAQYDVARNAAQKLGFAVFNTFIRDQLPFGTGDVSLDASAAKVSGYIPGTKIYVGFTRRFDAKSQLGENEDEVRMEYAITPHWALEGRWGSANTGGASLTWSKDY